MVWEADDGKSLYAPLQEVVCLGQPEGGIAAVARRSLRLEIAGRRVVIMFSGMSADETGDVALLQLDRLAGDVDPIAALATLKTAFASLGKSKDSAAAWTAIFAAASQDVTPTGQDAQVEQGTQVKESTSDQGGTASEPREDVAVDSPPVRAAALAQGSPPAAAGQSTKAEPAHPSAPSAAKPKPAQGQAPPINQVTVRVGERNHHVRARHRR